MSIVFQWKEEEFEALLRSCDASPDTPYILRYMPKEGVLLEAGCGMARYVVYMSRRGFDIQGVEIGRDAIRVAKRRYPETKIIRGDVARLPYPDDALSGIISLGVVEHSVEGPGTLLREMWRVLKPGHHAVITVPSLNYIRQVKYRTGYSRIRDRVKRIGLVRRLFGRDPLTRTATGRERYLYAPFLRAGDFFEYRFTKKEFEAELGKAGFTLVESVPTAQIDGVYHEFGRLFVSFGNWEFHPNLAGRLLNRLLSLLPFLHNHMHLCVLRKDPPRAVGLSGSCSEE